MASPLNFGGIIHLARNRHYQGFTGSYGAGYNLYKMQIDAHVIEYRG